MNAAIYDGWNSVNAVTQKMETLFPKVKLTHFLVDNENLSGEIRNGLECITFEEAVNLYKSGVLDCVIISASKSDHTLEKNVWSRSSKLKDQGVENILIIPSTLEKMPIDEMTEYDRTHFITKYEDFTEPLVIKWLAYEGCNLNCSGCSHFSPLVKRPKLLKPEEFKNDLYELKRIFGYIKYNFPNQLDYTTKMPLR